MQKSHIRQESRSDVAINFTGLSVPAPDAQLHTRLFHADSPPYQIVSLRCLRPRKVTEYNLIISFNYLFFLSVVQTQNTKSIRHLASSGSYLNSQKQS